MGSDEPNLMIFSRLGGDTDLAELVEMFVEEMPNRVGAFEQSCQEGNFPELCRLAHQMKGAAGSYGFDQITPYAAKLEKSIREKSPEDEILASLADLLKLCNRVRAGTPGDCLNS